MERFGLLHAVHCACTHNADPLPGSQHAGWASQAQVWRSGLKSSSFQQRSLLVPGLCQQCLTPTGTSLRSAFLENSTYIVKSCLCPCTHTLPLVLHVAVVITFVCRLLFCLQGALQSLKLMKANKRKFTILHGLNGRIQPGRMTLLLGPPGAGKSTLLMALAGKLRNSDLNVSRLAQPLTSCAFAAMCVQLVLGDCDSLQHQTTLTVVVVATGVVCS